MELEIFDIAPLVGDHLKLYYVYYCVAAAVLLPLILVFHRLAIPLILYAIEYSIYLVLFHIFMHFLLRMAAWFKDKSSMRRAFEDLTDVNLNPGWRTPLVEFWNKRLYEPEWVIFVEVLFAVIIFAIMWRVRPLRPQKRKKKLDDAKKTTASSVRQYKPGGN